MSYTRNYLRLDYTWCESHFARAKNPEKGKPLGAPLSSCRLMKQGDAFLLRYYSMDILKIEKVDDGTRLGTIFTVLPNALGNVGELGVLSNAIPGWHFHWRDNLPRMWLSIVQHVAGVGCPVLAPGMKFFAAPGRGVAELLTPELSVAEKKVVNRDRSKAVRDAMEPFVKYASTVVALEGTDMDEALAARGSFWGFQWSCLTYDADGYPELTPRNVSALVYKDFTNWQLKQRTWYPNQQNDRALLRRALKSLREYMYKQHGVRDKVLVDFMSVLAPDKEPIAA